MNLKDQEAPSVDLYLQVRLAFISQGTTFSAWCRRNRVCRQYAQRCLQYVHDGDKAAKLRQRIASAAGVM